MSFANSGFRSAVRDRAGRILQSLRFIRSGRFVERRQGSVVADLKPNNFRQGISMHHLTRFREPTFLPNELTSIHAILIALFFLLCVPRADAGQSKPEIIATSGLYLAEHETSLKSFLPLVIVNNGILLDPYLELSRVGPKSFADTYLSKQRFCVSQEGREFAIVDKLVLNHGKYCGVGPFFGEALFKGEVTPESNRTSGISSHRAGDFSPTYIGLSRPIAAPMGHLTRKDVPALVTPDVKAAAAIWERYGGTLVEKANMALNRRGADSEQSCLSTQFTRGSLSKLNAVDIDLDGKPDWIGIAEVVGTSTKDSVEMVENCWVGKFGFPFIVHGSGEFSVFAHFPKKGVLASDIDVIGTLKLGQATNSEVVLQVRVGDDSNKDAPRFGKRVEIYSSTASGWILLFQGQEVCLF